MAQIQDYATAAPEDIEADLGQRLEALRLSQNRNQTQIAEEAGVSRRTITRMENGEGVSLDTLIRVMRALGVVDRFQILLPDPAVRPVDRIRRKGRTRKHARPGAVSDTSPWQWGDESDESAESSND